MNCNRLFREERLSDCQRPIKWPAQSVSFASKIAKPKRCITRSLASHEQSQQTKTVVLHDYHNALVPYQEAWKWQQDLVTEMLSEKNQDIAGHIIFVQHPGVYTLGAGSTESHLRFKLENPPFPLHRTERGGEVTYHGPGQLVIYPILNLHHFTPDLHVYLRTLEEIIIRTLNAVSGIEADRIQGLTGVWADGKKLAAIGIRARRWITYHGLALNITTDLQPFQHIVPCGISDRQVTSVLEILKTCPDQPSHSPEDLIGQYRDAFLENFTELFSMQIVSPESKASEPVLSIVSS